MVLYLINPTIMNTCLMCIMEAAKRGDQKQGL